MLTGWSRPEIWDARGARHALRRAIEASAAVRVASTQRRLTLKHEQLERRRQAVVTAARRLTDNSSPGDRQAVVQNVLGYYYDLGELERAVVASYLPR